MEPSPLAAPPLTALVIVAFASGSSLVREEDRPSHFPIYRNGPPGTFVQLGTLRVSLPTDQIVSMEETDGAVTVGFGGMRFTGVQDDRLTFVRVRDLWPEERLSPARSWKMILEPSWVAYVIADGGQVWPPPALEPPE